MVKPVIRTGTMRPGPHTNSTVGTCDSGTLRSAGAPDDPPIAAAAAPAPALTAPTRPLAEKAPVGY